MLNTILLVPIYQSEDIFDEWVGWIKKLNPKPSKIIFCENNSTDKTLEKITNLKIEGVDIEVIRFWTADMRDEKLFPYKKCYDVVAHARQLLLTRARNLDPDYAIFIDSDIMLVDYDTIEGLTNWQKNIIGGAYRRVFPGGMYIATLFFASELLKDRIKKWVKHEKLDSKRILYEVVATSGGCLCLSRKLIQDRRVNFYPVPERYSEDFGYCAQARKVDYKIYLDGIILVGHKLKLKWRAWDVIRVKERQAYDYGTLLEDLQKESDKKNKLREEVKGFKRGRK